MALAGALQNSVHPFLVSRQGLRRNSRRMYHPAQNRMRSLTCWLKSANLNSYLQPTHECGDTIALQGGPLFAGIGDLQTASCAAPHVQKTNGLRSQFQVCTSWCEGGWRSLPRHASKGTLHQKREEGIRASITLTHARVLLYRMLRSHMSGKL